ncbi:hypothetical protein GQ457_02G013520 [Hibiscus cannabinus]
MRYEVAPLVSTYLHALSTIKTRKIWDDIRARNAKVDWQSSFGFTSQNTPLSLGCVSWIDSPRLIQMGIEVNPLCRLCGSDIETISHLFFCCPYSIEV